MARNIYSLDSRQMYTSLNTYEKKNIMLIILLPVIINKNKPMIYMEDVGRHNAVDKISGYMFLNNINPENKIFYTTGRLTSEMIIKTVKMKIPILISRSGFTSWGVEIAKKTNLTLIGRAKGKRYTILSGHERLKH